MLNICGTPTNETLSKITSEEVILLWYISKFIQCLNINFDRQYSTFALYHKWRRKTFRQYSQMQIPWVQNFTFCPYYNFLFFAAIDLMEKMLEVDSDKRINAAQTLSHPYLEEVCRK